MPVSIVIVDDNEEFRLVVRDLLRSAADLVTVVGATRRANLVRRLVLAAVVTTHQMNECQLVMSATI